MKKARKIQRGVFYLKFIPSKEDIQHLRKNTGLTLPLMGSALRKKWEELAWLNSAQGASWMWKAELSLLPGQVNRCSLLLQPCSHHHFLSWCCFKHKVCSTCGEGILYSSENNFIIWGFLKSSLNVINTVAFHYALSTWRRSIVFLWYSHHSRGVQFFVGTWFIPETTECTLHL